ncbi:hypothetical protein [Cellulomonas xylanilytica]|uniref:hypothetical protein n=1 Tax=Cellulomonas xylanilytica TaxID=233583 RepID=UPI0011BFCF4C|nr:hypothetical protein [Cellulomonas xylanilytica]
MGSVENQIERRVDWREVVVVLLLSVTTILTAWVGFQASKWGGSMSISFSQASTARIEASRLEGVANRKLDVQSSLFAQWVEATGSQNVPVAEFLQTRFPEPLATAFDAWIALEPLKNADAPLSPFDMPEYAIPELAQSADADRRADAKFAQALADNQRGDNYTVLTVAFASVLFFTAISERMRTPRGRYVLLGLGIVLFVAATVLLLTFPKLI